MANTIGRLDSSFTSLINDLMIIERQPLTRLTQRRDAMQVKKAMYSDMSTMFGSFQTLVKSLQSTESSYSFLPGRDAKVTSDDSDKQVLTALAGSSAMAGLYRINVTNLAAEHKVRSNRQTYANQMLGLNGTFRLGGDAVRSVSTGATTAGTVTDFTVAAPLDGQRELGSRDYFVETRQDTSSTWQFRLVDAEGQPIRIQSANTAGEFTNSWQSIPTGGGVADTGRGLQITFGSDPSQYQARDKDHDAAQATYHAEGASIVVEPEDSLIDIASSINNARYPEGNEISATIVDRQLILSTRQTGAGRQIQAADVSGNVLSALGIYHGGAFLNEMQAPASAEFTLNGLPVVRSGNNGLTDVIHDVNLSLSADAKDQQATIAITESTTKDHENIDGFIKKFNEVVSYLSEKSSTIKNADGTYKRGSLAGETIFTSLRLDMLRMVHSPVANPGALQSLNSMGITLDESLKLKVGDTSRLEACLLAQRGDVVALLDGVTAQLDSKLARFTGSAGYMTQASRTIADELETANDQMNTMNTRLSAREAALRQQFAMAQAEIMSNTYLMQQLGTVFSSSMFWGG